MPVGGCLAPVHEEVVVRVELGHTLPAVAVADEVRALRQPGDVGGPVEEPPRVPPSLAECAVGENELTVISELVDDVELVVDDPDVLFWIVGAHLDLVGSSAAWKLRKEFVGVRPFIDHVAVPIKHDDAVLEAPLPSATVLRGVTRGA